VKLYSFFRSSAAYRTRIALNLKGLPFETIGIHLSKDGGRNNRPEFRAVNPQMRVPALALDTGDILIQSLAIIEYLDETHPQPPLLPKDPLARARVRGISQVIACDIHPLNNVGPLRYLKNQLHHEQAEIDAWYHHWVTVGFEALEQMIAPAPYTCGSEVTLADVCLVPQVYNARRFNCDLTPYPTLVRIADGLRAEPAFARAAPEAQPDAK
jgi:maleylacetoacetate isomerase